jgi:FkbM family methyltransferase
MNSDYLYEGFTRLIDKRSIHTIIECGSRDGLDTIALEEFFNPDVIYSFECNPESIPVCLGNIEGHEKILFSNMAVTNIDGRVKFYPTDMRKSPDKNIGASSLFRHTRGLVQKEIEVGAVRLDTFMQLQNINHIDLLCMDLQGAEPLAVEGLGERKKDVTYIITEVAGNLNYDGEIPFSKFNEKLIGMGFICLCKRGTNAVYKHK